MNLILLGFKSCGKTTYGKTLSERLGRPFFDTDQIIEKNVGMSCREFYQRYGDAAFRALETDALLALQQVHNSIIALGGGLVLNPNHIEQLYQLGTLVYMILDYETLAERILSESLPAYLDPLDPEGSLRRHYCQCIQMFQSIRAHHLPLSGKSDETILNELERFTWAVTPSAPCLKSQPGENPTVKLTAL